MNTSPWAKEAGTLSSPSLRMYSVIITFVFAKKGEDTFEVSTVHGCVVESSPESAIENIGGGVDPGTYIKVKEEAFDITEFVIKSYAMIE